MDNYPAYPQAEGTARRFRSGILIRTASNGASRARALSSAMRGDPTLVHLALTEDELDALLAFHEAHRGVPFDVDYWPEDVTIPCLFADPPFDSKAYVSGSGLRYRVSVNLIQQT